MSLINDALRRAQQEQQRAPASTASLASLPALRPVEPRPTGESSKWILILLAFFLIAAAGMFLWLGLRQTTTSPPLLATSLPATPPTAASLPATVAPPADPVVKTAPVVAPPAAVEPPVQTNTVTVVVTNFVGVAAPVTNSPPAPLPTPAPVFPTLKLQGIFYRPSNPSVMLNGKTLFLNDEVDKVKVTAITQTSVTVVWSGQTNVLTLR